MKYIAIDGNNRSDIESSARVILDMLLAKGRKAILLEYPTKWQVAALIKKERAYGRNYFHTMEDHHTYLSYLIAAEHHLFITNKINGVEHYLDNGYVVVAINHPIFSIADISDTEEELVHHFNLHCNLRQPDRLYYLHSGEFDNFKAKILENLITATKTILVPEEQWLKPEAYSDILEQEPMLV